MTAVTSPRIFVLDTNVILHDSGCMLCFDEHDVVLPLVVLEELDRFKRGNSDIHFHAREFLRLVDELTGDALSAEGVRLGEGKGCLRIVAAHTDPEVRARFFTETPDHRILSTAMEVRRRHAGHTVILVSKDTNLRMKAKSLGLIAQDFTADQVHDVDSLYKGKRLVENIPTEIISMFYEGSGAVPLAQVPEVGNPLANESFILRNGSRSALATYHADTRSLHRLQSGAAYGIKARNAEQSFALQALLDDRIQLVTLSGRAGTGKTLLALAAALECRSRYHQILLARPIVPLSNRELGFLPGDVDSKISPYMQPLFDNLSVIRRNLGDGPDAQRIGRMLEDEKLLVTPLAYIRGRTLPQVYFIVDEAQNLTPHEVKTIITRAGAGTKVVLTGDIRQIDHPYLDPLSNGLSYVISRMMNQPLYAHVALEKGERSDLSNLASELL